MWFVLRGTVKKMIVPPLKGVAKCKRGLTVDDNRLTFFAGLARLMSYDLGKIEPLLDMCLHVWMNLITSRLVPITFLAVISVAKALLGFYFGINVFFLVVF